MQNICMLFTRAVVAPKTKHVIIGCKRLKFTAGKYRQHLTQRNRIAVYGRAVLIARARSTAHAVIDLSPRHGGAIVRVTIAFKSQLIPIVHARHARHGHLNNARRPQTALAQTALVG